MRRRISFLGSAGLALMATPAVLAQQATTLNGPPVQVAPYVPEPGVPLVTVAPGTPNPFAGLADQSGSSPTPGASGGASGDSSGAGAGAGVSVGSSPTNGATASTAGSGSVTYTNPDGTTTTLTGGSLAWRDNNPGNLVYNSNTIALGAIGSNNGFAVFPDLSTGTAALTSILNSSTYQSLSIDAAIARYAPAFENNTSAYQSFVTNTLGVSGTTTLSSLSPSQMQSLQSAIQTQEGYKVGTISN